MKSVPIATFCCVTNPLKYIKMKMKEGENMAKGKVSSYTHTQQQLNHYANQHNPNNSAYKANYVNHANQMNPNNKNYQSSKKAK